jgi:hypothetical protein
MSTRSLMLVLATTAVSLIAATAAATEGQKLDNGLGDLPPYSQWQDKSGRAPVGARVAGESLDNGLGELPHYAQWLDKTGREPMGRGAQQVASR